jgi:hypothetical protein
VRCSPPPFTFFAPFSNSTDSCDPIFSHRRGTPSHSRRWSSRRMARRPRKPPATPQHQRNDGNEGPSTISFAALCHTYYRLYQFFSPTTSFRCTRSAEPREHHFKFVFKSCNASGAFDDHTSSAFHRSPSSTSPVPVLVRRSSSMSIERCAVVSRCPFRKVSSSPSRPTSCSGSRARHLHPNFLGRSVGSGSDFDNQGGHEQRYVDSPLSPSTFG